MVVKRIVPSHPEFTDYDIQGFQGQDKRRLVFRAYLPLTPRMQTLSVVATMRYVRKHTSLDVDVPEVISYCADASKTDLKFEYVLMRYPPGITIDEALPNSSKRVRKQIAYQIAGLYKRCEEDQAFWFNQLGSLYQTEPDRHEEVDSDLASSFHVGYMLGHWFTDAQILSYMSRPGNEFGISAGPFHSAFDLQVAIVDCCQKRLIEGLELWFGEDFEMFNQSCRDCRAAILENCRECLEKLNRWKAGYTETRFYLEKGNRTSQDILVDPVTWKITGLINWENTITVFRAMRPTIIPEVNELTFRCFFYARDGDPPYMLFNKREQYMDEIAHWFQAALIKSGRVVDDDVFRNLWNDCSLLLV